MGGNPAVPPEPTRCSISRRIGLGGAPPASPKRSKLASCSRGMLSLSGGHICHISAVALFKLKPIYLVYLVTNKPGDVTGMENENRESSKERKARWETGPGKILYSLPPHFFPLHSIFLLCKLCRDWGRMSFVYIVSLQAGICLLLIVCELIQGLFFG